MTKTVLLKSYLRSRLERSAEGILLKERPEPTIDEARVELSEAISRVVSSIFKDRYGPLLSAVSQPAVNEFLRDFESKCSRAKGDLTLVLEELLERVVSKNLRKRN